jgi:hypothetical protein
MQFIWIFPFSLCSLQLYIQTDRPKNSYATPSPVILLSSSRLPLSKHSPSLTFFLPEDVFWCLLEQWPQLSKTFPRVHALPRLTGSSPLRDIKPSAMTPVSSHEAGPYFSWPALRTKTCPLGWVSSLKNNNYTYFSYPTYIQTKYNHWYNSMKSAYGYNRSYFPFINSYNFISSIIGTLLHC